MNILVRAKGHQLGEMGANERQVNILQEILRCKGWSSTLGIVTLKGPGIAGPPHRIWNGDEVGVDTLVGAFNIHLLITRSRAIAGAQSIIRTVPIGRGAGLIWWSVLRATGRWTLAIVYTSCVMNSRRSRRTGGVAALEGAVLRRGTSVCRR